MPYYKVTFHLKSGQSLNVYLEDISIGRSDNGTTIASLSWKNKGEDTPCLAFIDIQDISAIVSIIDERGRAYGESLEWEYDFVEEEKAYQEWLEENGS